MYSNIVNEIESAIAGYETAHNITGMWRKPLVAVIPADEEHFDFLKKAVSPDHLMPADILPGAKSVISFFIPFCESITKSNTGGEMASPEWAAAYTMTNDLIKNINDKIALLMESKGCMAGKIPATHNFDTVKLVSNWSHRHIAYMAGLGTFGINNMLITEKGCCGRFGSIVVDYRFGEYSRTGAPEEKCLYKRNGSCGICRKRCVAGAYETGGFNRQKCYAKCLENSEYHKQTGFADVCGKCLVGLPCSSTDPLKQLLSKR